MTTRITVSTRGGWSQSSQLPLSSTALREQMLAIAELDLRRFRSAETVTVYAFNDGDSIVLTRARYGANCPACGHDLYA